MKQKVVLVAISFESRDLCLGSVALKGSVMKNADVKKNFDIEIVQFYLDKDVNAMVEELKGKNADVFGFTCYVWNFHQTLEVSKRLKEEYPDITIIYGGPEASGMAERILRLYDFVDYVVKRDGELAFQEFLLQRVYNTPIADLCNLYYRDGDEIKYTVRQNQQVEINDIPLPHELEDYRKYLDDSDEMIKAQIETLRDCPFACTYCNWGNLGKPLRYFDIERLKEGFRYLFNHPKVKSIYITDSNPFLRLKRAKELVPFLLKENHRKLPISYELNPEFINDDELLVELAKLDNEEFAFGLQTAVPKVQKLIKRSFNPNRYKKNISILRKYKPNCRMWFSLIIGLPGDTIETFSYSVNFALELQPHGLYFHELVVIPGSELYENSEKNGINFLQDPPHTIIDSDTFSKADIVSAKTLGFHVGVMLSLKVSERFHKLWEEMGKEIPLVSLYKEFMKRIDGKIDFLFGRSMECVSTWEFDGFYEKCKADKELVAETNELFDEFSRQVSESPKSVTVEELTPEMIAAKI